MSAERTERTAATVPDTFGGGRYQVTGRLGNGGMGVVVRARDEVLDRDVAIKILADEVAADPDHRARFLREARAAAAIHDPHVVSVHDVGEEGGRPYLVMECVVGPSLADVLSRDGPLDPDDVLDVAVDVLTALFHAHEAGVLHRDIKPANLLRAADGTVKVSDFGVAVAADAARLTRTGHVVGTIGYLAPERQRGEPASVASDLWAVGATLLELLTGHGPSTQNRPDTLPLAASPLLILLLEALLADAPAARPSSAEAALALLAEDVATGIGQSQAPEVRSRDDHADLPATQTLPLSHPADLTAATQALPAAAGAEATTEALPAATGPATTPIDPARWTRVAIGAIVLLLAVLAINAIAGGDAETAGETTRMEVEIDPDDPAGTLRDLAEQLRQRAGS